MVKQNKKFAFSLELVHISVWDGIIKTMKSFTCVQFTLAHTHTYTHTHTLSFTLQIIAYSSLGFRVSVIQFHLLLNINKCFDSCDGQYKT